MNKKIIYGALAFIVVLLGGLVVYNELAQKPTAPLEVDVIAELVSNFKNYDGNEVSIFLNEVKVIGEPLNPKSNDCMLSSVPPIECCGVWRYNVSDESNETVMVISGEKIKQGKTLKGIFNVGCDYTSKVHFSCEIKDHYCECKKEKPEEIERVDLLMAITTDSAYQKLQKSEGCFWGYPARQYPDVETQQQVTITTDKAKYSQGEIVEITIGNNSKWPIFINPVFSIMPEYLTEQNKWLPVVTTIGLNCDCFPELTCDDRGLYPDQTINPSEDYTLAISSVGLVLHQAGQYRISLRIKDKEGVLGPMIYSNEFRIVEKGENTPNETSLKDCSQNSDCIKVLINPCTSALKICKATAINKNYKDDWDNLLANCAETGVACQESEPGDITFTMDPECVNQRCELTKQRPYTVAPYCGAKTTDHLISFGWFPVDYESKHLIQIDNNADFSSPEIETYETASGIFTPESPLANGTYYWRVKSTKSEKEKCIAPPCAPSEDPNDPCNIAIESYKQCKAQYSKWSDVCMITIETF